MIKLKSERNNGILKIFIPTSMTELNIKDLIQKEISNWNKCEWKLNYYGGLNESY